MTQVKKIPEGYQNITPLLVVKGGLQAIEYYEKVFGAVNNGTMMMPDGKSVHSFRTSDKKFQGYVI